MWSSVPASGPPFRYTFKNWNIQELLDGHVTLQVECLDGLYLNGYFGALATQGRLVTFRRVQLGKPVPSPVVRGQVSEKFREAVKAQAERQQIPIYHYCFYIDDEDFGPLFTLLTDFTRRMPTISIKTEKGSVAINPRRQRPLDAASANTPKPSSVSPSTNSVSIASRKMPFARLRNTLPGGYGRWRAPARSL